MTQIINAKLEHFDEIFELLITLYDQNNLDRNKILNLFKQELNNSIQIVAINNNKVIGFSSASHRLDFQEQGQISLLTNLVVNQDFRSNGIGSQLLEKIEKKCKEIGSIELHFSSTFRREKAHGFYKSKGYQKTAYYFWKRL